MPIDKSLLAGSTTLLVLKLLEDGDKYGYQMVEELRRRSDKTFELKSGTLYPLLHTLEQKGDIEAWEEDAGSARPRRYYHLTESGRRRLAEKEAEWRTYAGLFPLAAVGAHRYLSEILFLLLVGPLLLALLAWRDWYGIGKGRTVGVLAGGIGLLGGLCIVKVLTSNYLRNRVLYAIHPELDPLGGGYTGLTIQQALKTARWTGQGEWTGSYSYEMSVYDGQGDFFLTTVIHKLGWLPFLLLVLAVFLLAAWMLAKCLKQKNTLAQLTVLAVVVPLLLRGIWAVILNLGVVMFTVHFPMLTGNTVLVIDMALIGLALSVFRQEHLPMTNRVPSKPCAD